jgi:hypothetical protein
MSHASAEYNGDHLTPEQIEFLHGALVADLDEFAAEAEEPEPEEMPSGEIEDLEPEAGS